MFDLDDIVRLWISAFLAFLVLSVVFTVLRFV